MEVEYLNEHANLFSKNLTSTHCDSNSNISVSLKRKAITDNSNELLKGREFHKLSMNYEKEDINEGNINEQSNNVRTKQLPSEVNKIAKNFKMSLNANSCEQDKISNVRKKMTNSGKKIQNTIEVSTKLNDIYETTYELKKDYYEAKLACLRRSVEAMEKIANVIEKRNMFQ